MEIDHRILSSILNLIYVVNNIILSISARNLSATHLWLYSLNTISPLTMLPLKCNTCLEQALNQKTKYRKSFSCVACAWKEWKRGTFAINAVLILHGSVCRIMPILDLLSTLLEKWYNRTLFLLSGKPWGLCSANGYLNRFSHVKVKRKNRYVCGLP